MLHNKKNLLWFNLWVRSFVSRPPKSILLLFMLAVVMALETQLPNIKCNGIDVYSDIDKQMILP